MAEPPQGTQGRWWWWSGWFLSMGVHRLPMGDSATLMLGILLHCGSMMAYDFSQQMVAWWVISRSTSGPPCTNLSIFAQGVQMVNVGSISRL